MVCSLPLTYGRSQPPMTLIYFLAISPVSMTEWRSCRLRLPVLWLFRCFLPAWLRLSLPVPVILNRFLDALCVFCFGMTHHLAASGGVSPLLSQEQGAHAPRS